MADRQFLEQLTKQLANDGKLIEAGWVALRLQAIPPNAPAIQLHEMRLAFMAGAQHLFASMVWMLDSGLEETPDDMRRMDLIHEELDAFRRELELWVGKTQGAS
jgi:hypothetical protein